MAKNPSAPSTPWITLRLEEDLRARMEKLAAESDRSLSAEVRQAIRAYLESKVAA